MLILARARGISVFDAAAIDVVSMPITVIAGLAQSRCGTEPSPISDTPSSRPESARTRSARVIDVRGGTFVHAGHGHVAVVVVQAGQ